MTDQANKKESESTSVLSSITALREKLDALLDRLNRGLDGGYDAIRVSRDEFCDWTDALEAIGELLERAEREIEDWHKQLGDGPPSYHRAGIDLMKGDLDAWIERAGGAERREAALLNRLEAVKSIAEAAVTERIGALSTYDRQRLGRAVLAALASPAPPAPQTEEQRDFTRGGSPGSQ